MEGGERGRNNMDCSVQPGQLDGGVRGRWLTCSRGG